MEGPGDITEGVAVDLETCGELRTRVEEEGLEIIDTGELGIGDKLGTTFFLGSCCNSKDEEELARILFLLIVCSRSNCLKSCLIPGGS